MDLFVRVVALLCMNVTTNVTNGGVLAFLMSLKCDSTLLPCVLDCFRDRWKSKINTEVILSYCFLYSRLLAKCLFVKF